MFNSFVNVNRMSVLRQVFVRCVVLLAAVALFCGSPAEAQKRKKKKGRAAAEESSDRLLSALPDDRAIDLAISEMLAAWQIGDLGRLHKYYADDVVVVSGAWEPPVTGWENYAKSYQSQRDRTQNVVIDRTNTYIKVLGNIGWAGYQWDFKAMVDDKTTTWRGHTTLIFEKQKDHWVIVHNHTSLAQEAAGAQPRATPDPPTQAPPL